MHIHAQCMLTCFGYANAFKITDNIIIEYFNVCAMSPNAMQCTRLNGPGSTCSNSRTHIQLDVAMHKYEWIMTFIAWMNLFTYAKYRFKQFGRNENSFGALARHHLKNELNYITVLLVTIFLLLRFRTKFCCTLITKWRVIYWLKRKARTKQPIRGQINMHSFLLKQQRNRDEKIATK